VRIRAIIGRLSGFIVSFFVSSPEHFASFLSISALYCLSDKHLLFILTKKNGFSSDFLAKKDIFFCSLSVYACERRGDFFDLIVN